MKPPRMRIWNEDLKQMEYPETIYTRDSVHVFLNTEDYIWMRSSEEMDRKGKEIYQGDILRNINYFGDIEIVVVTFETAYALDCVDCGADPHHLCGLSLGANYSSARSEIIGNIYENPDLNPFTY